MSSASAIARRMKKFGVAMPKAAGGGLYREMVRVMNRAVPMTPVEHSRLRGTAYVSPPRGEEQTVEGGYGTKYAVPVHEKTDPDVNWGAPGTGPKFLEKAIDQTDSGRLERIAADTWNLYRQGRAFGRPTHDFPTRPREES